MVRVASARFDRALSNVTGSATCLRTLTFPRTAHQVEGDAFSCAGALESVVVNEGFTELFGRAVWRGRDWFQMNVFEYGKLRRVTFPSSLRVLGERLFAECIQLRRVTVAEGLARIGPSCFRGSGIAEFIAPKSLREIRELAFCNCWSLRRVVLQEGLETL